jgi:DNA-binding XRE family transcriptional regulator
MAVRPSERYPSRKTADLKLTLPGSASLPAVPTPLKLFRIASGMRQADLELASHVSREQISRLELGRCQPHAETRRRLADALAQPEAVVFPDPDTRTHL